MENQKDRGNKARERQETNSPVKKPLAEWGRRIIGHVKRKMDERKARKRKETPADKAARITARATVWMAAFTFVLAIVSSWTLWEIHTGSADTQKLAEAAFHQSRAWVVIKGTRFMYRMDENKVPRVRATIVVSNTGPTPAFNTSAIVCGQVRDAPPWQQSIDWEAKVASSNSLAI